MQPKTSINFANRARGRKNYAPLGYEEAIGLYVLAARRLSVINSFQLKISSMRTPITSGRMGDRASAERRESAASVRPISVHNILFIIDCLVR